MASVTGTFENFSELARDAYFDYFKTLSEHSDNARSSIEQALDQFSKVVQGVNENINAHLIAVNENYVQSLTAAWSQTQSECEQAYETYAAALGELLSPPTPDELARHEELTNLFQARRRDASESDSVSGSDAEALTEYLTESAKVWNREAEVKRVIETAETYFKHLHEYLTNAQSGTAAAHRDYITALQSLSNKEDVSESYASACQTCFDDACRAWSEFQANQASAIEDANARIKVAATEQGQAKQGNAGQLMP